MRLTLARVCVILLLPVIILSKDIYRESTFIDIVFENVGCSLLFIAAAGRIWTAAWISGKKGKQLVVDGPYAIVRHPLYLFSAIGFVGAGFALESLTLTAALLGVFLLSHYSAMIREEQFLVQNFGNEAKSYFASRNRLWPGCRFQIASKVGHVDLKIYTQAVLDALLIGLVFPGVHLLEWLHLKGLVPVLFHLY
ncbi:MAG: methyltransferase family protein [Thermogutta sp.]